MGKNYVGPEQLSNWVGFGFIWPQPNNHNLFRQTFPPVEFIIHEAHSHSHL